MFFSAPLAVSSNTLVFENSAVKKPSRGDEQSRDVNRESPKPSESDEQRRDVNGKLPRSSGKVQLAA